MRIVFGALIACGGLVLFALAINFVRRPNAHKWFKTRLFRELAVFSSMISLLGGLAMIAGYMLAKGHQTPGLDEVLEAGAIFAATAFVVWRLWRPIPAEDMPAPVFGFDPTTIGPQPPAASGMSRKKAA